MNNIYKVIWSKAKNCYVVASEIARSHTKSASGSEKIGGVARHALLALGAACAIACGGFVNVGAADTVEVTTTGSSTATVYTKEGVDQALNEKIEGEKNARVEFDQALNEKIEGEKNARVEFDQALNEKIEGEKNARVEFDQALNEKIEGEKTTRFESDQALNQKIEANTTAIDDLKTKATTTDATLTNLSGHMAAAESDIDGLQADMATAKSDIGTLKGDMSAAKSDIGTLKGDMSTAKSDIGTLKVKDTELSGKIDTEIANRITSDTALDHKIDAEIANRITSDTALDHKIDTEIQDRKDAIKATNDRTGGIARNLEGTQTTIEGIVKVDNQGNVKDVNELSAKKITTTEDAVIGGKLGVTGETTLNDKLTAKGEATFEKNVTMEKDLEVKGELKTDKISMKNTDTDPDGTIHRSATTITADGITHNGEVEKSGVITKSQFTHTEEGSETYAKKGDATDWTETRSDVKADGVKTEVKDSKQNRTNTSQTAKGINGSVTDKDGNTTYTKVTATENSFQVQDKDGKNKNHQVNTKDSSVTEITDENGATTTKTEQTAKDITNTAEQGTITNKAQTIVNNATGDMTNTVGGKLTTTVTGQATEEFNGGLNTTVTGTENHTVNGKQINTVTEGQENIISGGQTNTITGGQINSITGDQTTTITGNKKETVTENVTEDYQKNLTTTVGGNEIHDVTGNQDIHVTGKQTNKIDGDQENTIGGNQTTTVTGDISNKAENITNEANTKLTDKVGDHTRVLDGDGITDTVGGSTFKQRIDKIMMESKDVSIKAEETLTNEAKVITNKASEVINNEAININNTATGIITSKASEIKNQADKLISNKVGENTWENMEDGKITTSIKDGTKQNLTQSDAAGTTQSTVDGAKSTVTIQNADGLTGAVTDGRNTSVQNQTASAIATDVKDGAGNENASVANATTSANTITNGTKANTVISTADGTSFINSEAATPVGEGTVRNTTIKGNTITTGKVTMDYAEVMNDLGVHGSAKVDQNLEVGGTSTLKGDVTMESNATVKKDLTVEGTTTTKTLKVTEDAEVGRDLSVGGNATITGDVTANSYKVGDKTYISAAGINANDQKITNVADGSISEGSKDAVNGGQLYGVKRDLEHQVDKVGANAAAMANLRPMEFDPSSKWNIAAAIGNYGSETAAALGAFYRPNDNVMVNLSTAFGTGENMVGGGVSVRLGKGGNKLSREETNALKAQVADLTARMDALLSVLNPNMSKDFPDVPENHWAYEAVSRLAGNDIVQGYPDGEFHGERTMTRYEMAEIIYNALSRGAEAERELVEEFKPELQAMAASEKATAEKAEG